MPRKYVLKNPPPLEKRQERARAARAAQATTGYHVSKLEAKAGELTSQDIEALRALLARAEGGTTQ